MRGANMRDGSVEGRECDMVLVLVLKPDVQVQERCVAVRKWQVVTRRNAGRKASEI